MTDTLTSASLAELREMHEKATPGLWWADLPTAMERGCFVKTDSSVSILPTVADAESTAALHNSASQLFDLAQEALARRESDYRPEKVAKRFAVVPVTGEEQKNGD